MRIRQKSLNYEHHNKKFIVTAKQAKIQHYAFSRKLSKSQPPHIFPIRNFVVPNQHHRIHRGFP